MRRAWLAAVALGVASLGCDPEPIGGIVLAVQTDVHLPKDIDTIRIEVFTDGVPKFKNDYERLGTPGAPFKLPGTLTLVASDKPDAAVHVIVSARRGGKDGQLRVVRDVITTVPASRTATMQLPMQFLCDGQAKIDGDNAVTSCPDGQTCLAGTCADAHIDSGTLADYDPADIFVPGVCLDVGVCFNLADEAPVDTTDCTLDPATDVNIALETEGDGICGAVGCFVALDGESSLGWTRHADGRIQLPPAVCEKLGGVVRRVVKAPTSTACPAKKVGVPTCGPWSAAGGGSSDAAPVVLAGAQDHPLSLTLAPDTVFWTSAGTFAADGAIKSVGLIGGTPNVVADGLAAPRDITTSPGGEVVWTTATLGAQTGQVVKLNKANKLVTLADMLDLPEGVAVSGADVYWSEFTPDGGIRFTDLAGSNPTNPPLLAKGSYPSRVAADDTYVYWTNEGLLGSMPPDGSVVRFKKSGGVAPEVIAGAQATPRSLALEMSGAHATAVYWTTFAPSGAVSRADVSGQTVGAVTSLATGQGYPSGIALDEAHVYWTNRDDGTVVRTPKSAAPGSPPEVLATGQRAPSKVVIDATNVYWINEGTSDGQGGAVVRLAKPTP